MNLSKKPLAMAYVPWQTFENVMEGECADRHVSSTRNASRCESW